MPVVFLTDGAERGSLYELDVMLNPDRGRGYRPARHPKLSSRRRRPAIPR